MTTKQPEALRLAEMLKADEWPGSVTLVSYAQECVAELLTQHARITELESQLAQCFDAADMATAAAQGFRDGVASLSANAGEPRNAIDRDALIDAIAQGLHGTWHCTRAWEAWHVGTMSQDDFEPVDESETPTEIADAVLALLAAPPQPSPTAQSADSVPALDRDRIREIFMAYGFTVKEGQTDLKQYVYDAADALLRAARDPADSVQEDAARLDFIERHPEMSLRHRKGRWAFLGFTNYEYDLHQSLRDAVDAAMLEEKV